MPSHALAGYRWLGEGLPIAAACLAVAMLVTYRLRQMGSWPTGVDGGNWLAIGRAFPGGGDLPNGGAYPPLVPVAARVLSTVMAPDDAIRVIAISSLVALVGAVLVVAWAEAGWWPAALAAAMVALGRPVNEPVAFGGYPQNFGIAGSLLALWLLAGAAKRPARRRIAMATAGMVLVAIAHHMYFLFAAAATVTLIATAALRDRWWRTPLKGQHAVLMFPLAAGVAVFVPSLIAMDRAGYEPAVNVSGTSLSGAIDYGFRGATWAWVAVWAAGLAVPMLGTRLKSGPRSSPLSITTWAMLLTATTGFLVTAEPRLLPAIAVAAPLPVALWLSHASKAAHSTVLSALLAAGPFSVLLAIAPAQNDITDQDFAYYRMLDEGFVEAAAWAEQHPAEGVTAVRADARNWPVGWWWRGLTTPRVAVGSNPKWLSFEAEREEAEMVRTIFAEKDAGDAIAVAREHGVTRLVVPARDWIGWRQWLGQADGALSVVYENSSIVILDLGADY